MSDPNQKEVKDQLEPLSDDFLARRLVYMKEIAHHDYISALEAARQEGRQEVTDQQQVKIIQKMAASGMDLKTIAEIL